MIRAVLGRLAAAWSAYWFRPGYALSLPIARVAVFAAVLVSLRRLPFWAGPTEGWYARVSAAAYVPKGPLRLLFPDAPPPPELVDAAVWAAVVASAMAIVGLRARAAAVAAALLAWCLHAHAYSFVAVWSHPHNVVVLAALALMVGRSGDRLSLDALLRRARGAPGAVDEGAGRYAWPVLLAQAAVALFYFGGFWAKVAAAGDPGLPWVFSDSLRNMLIQPWHVADLAPPAHVAFVASHPAAWQAVAAGHLLCQATPLLACLHTRRPLLRLAEGLVFALGVLLLGLFMGYWNQHWLFLTALFVDWDHFLARARRRARPAPAALAAGGSPA